MVMLKGSWPMMITNLPAPVWMASADNCSGAMVLYSCCWLFWAGTSAAGFLTWGTSMTWAFPTMPSDAFSVAWAGSTVTCFFGVITVGPELTTAFTSFFSSFFSSTGALAVVALNASAAPRQRSSTKSTVFLRHLASPRTSLVFALFKAYLSTIHSSAVYFSFPSR